MKLLKKSIVMSLLLTLFLPLSTQVNAASEWTTTGETSIPEWSVELFEDKAQNNTMLERAWEDYQTATESYQLADMGTMEQGTFYNQVLESYEAGSDVEVSEADGGDGTASISYVYRAEEGDMNPTTGIEDWAQVDFYFVNDNLIYTGITTLSLAFMSDKLVSNQEHSDLISNNATTEELLNIENLELNGFGQILVDGEYAYGIGYPKEASTIGEGGLIIIQDGTVVDDTTVPFEELMAYSFSGYIYLMLVTQVDNQIFEPGQ